MPLLGSNLRAAARLPEVGRDTGAAAAHLLELGQPVDADREPDAGVLPLTNLDELGLPLRTLFDELDGSTERLDSIPTAGLIERVAEARHEHLELAEPQLERAVLAADLVEALPTFLVPTSHVTASSALQPYPKREARSAWWAYGHC